MSDEIDLLGDFRAIVEALEHACVDYAVVGALALAVHGFARATTDIDLLIRPEDLERVLRAVEPLGYRFPAEPMRFRGGTLVQRVTRVLGDDHLTLDLLLVDERLEHAWGSRERVSSGQESITVISRDALVEMKAAAGRAQDLVDIDRLRREGDD